MIVHLKDVRLSFAQALFTPQQVQGQGEAKYSSTFVFAPTHPAVAALKKAFEAVAKEEWGNKASEVYARLKAGDRIALHDGDAKAYDGYKGNLYIAASNKIKPTVIDGNLLPVTAESGKIYSGCYVNAIVDVWAMDNKFGQRINATLMGVQFVRDGERMSGGGVAAVEMFEAIPEAAATSGEGFDPFK